MAIRHHRERSGTTDLGVIRRLQTERGSYVMFIRCTSINTREEGYRRAYVSLQAMLDFERALVESERRLTEAFQNA